MAKQIAHAARAFHCQQTGHAPNEVSVVLNDNLLVVSLHDALTPAERALAVSPSGAARLQEVHLRHYDVSGSEFKREIKDITGAAVCNATPEIEATTGPMVRVFSTGALVLVFLLASSFPEDAWTDPDSSFAINSRED